MFFIFLWYLNFAVAVDMLFWSIRANEKQNLLISLSLLWTCLVVAAFLVYI